MTKTHEAKQAPRTVKLGTTGPEVFALGLGCMGMSGMYGATNDAESIRTLHTAIERGVTLLDTGDFYGWATTSCSWGAPSRAGGSGCSSP